MVHGIFTKLSNHHHFEFQNIFSLRKVTPYPLAVTPHAPSLGASTIQTCLPPHSPLPESPNYHQPGDWPEMKSSGLSKGQHHCHFMNHEGDSLPAPCHPWQQRSPQTSRMLTSSINRCRSTQRGTGSPECELPWMAWFPVAQPCTRNGICKASLRD